MPTIAHLTDPDAVHRAIAEHDLLGKKAFLAKYRYGPAKTWLLLRNGKEYDSKAIAGVAVELQHGRRPTRLHGGMPVVKRLKALDFTIVSRSLPDESAALPEEIGRTFEEGASRTVTVNKWERSPEAREECLEARGRACLICGFDAKASFGKDFTGLIHVHHVIPLGEHRGTRQVNPRTELFPVCPNCHAAIHYGGTTRTIEQMRKIVGARRKSTQ